MTDIDGLNKLFELQKYLAELGTTATTCAMNYRYYQIERRGEEIPLFDCDSIWAAVRLPNARERIQRTRGASMGVTELIDEMTALTGPHTLRYLMGHLTHYAIPAGAQAELLRKKESMDRALSDGARQILTRFEHTATAASPVEDLVKSGQTAQIAAQVTRDMATIDSLYDDREFIAQTLRRAQSIDDLLGQPGKDTGPAYFTSYSQLQQRRESFDRNNFSDAINLALLVWLFNSPKGGRSTSPVPVLVTGTKMVSDLQALLPLPRSEQVTLLPKPLYLLLSQALKNRHKNHLQGVVVDAQALGSTCDRIREQINCVFDRAQRRRKLDGAPFHILRDMLSGFIAHWQDVLDPLKRYPTLDRISYANTLLSPQLHDLLAKIQMPDLGGVDDHLALIAALQNAVDTKRDFLQRLLIDPSAPEVSDGAFEPTIDLTVVDPADASTLLKNQKPGELLKSGEWPSLLRAQSSRIALFVSPLASLGALLVADWTPRGEGDAPMPARTPNRRGGAGPCLSVTWSNTATLGQVCSSMIRLVQRLPAADTCRLNLYGLSGPSNDTFNLSEPDPARALEKHCHNRDSIELLVGPIGLYADLEPLMIEEHQIGIVAPIEAWSSHLMELALDLAMETRLPLPKRHTRLALRSIVQFFSRPDESAT
jgi:hypothetical protein